MEPTPDLIESTARKMAESHWRNYISAAEVAIRYLLVERVVQVQRDTITPQMKDEFFHTHGRTFAGDKPLGGVTFEAAERVEGGIITEDDGDRKYVAEAIHTIVRLTCSGKMLSRDETRLIEDACSMARSAGLWSGAPICNKPYMQRAAVIEMVKLAAHVHTIKQDYADVALESLTW